ncbi:MAG TPA: GDSL-type esterase/lipase family protein [Terriglobia bacterium]|nr:GDSL-type esterase/lipase family protein [Terriglobia bacterium]
MNRPRSTRALAGVTFAAVLLAALVSGFAGRGWVGTAYAAHPPGRSQAQAAAPAVVIKPGDPHFHFVGHWDRRSPGEAITVNSGSRMLCAFTGTSITGLFGTAGIASPAQIWVRIDGGEPARYTANSETIDFAPHGLAPGRHTLELDVKDVDERVNRWIPPLQAALIFKGLELPSGGRLEKSPLPGKLRMEFYGDSITQGVRIDSMAIGPEGSDGTKDYAFLVALVFGALHNQVGFGRQGILRTGNGNVPPAADSFGWNFQGSPDDPSFVPRVVAVNQGTNDGGYSSVQFEPAYRAYIAEIRNRYPKAAIFCLRTFGGFHADDIRQAVEEMHDSEIRYVDTTGWLEKSDYTDGIHPNAGGQIKAAQQLADVIHRSTGLKIIRPVASVAPAGP